MRADNDEFQPRINLENLLNPNRLEMEATTSASQSSIPNNRSNWIQNAMDSWDAMIAREATGTRDEPVETIEQCEMVTTLQTDGTDMEKATADLSKSLVSLNPSSILTTIQLPCWNIDHKIVGSPKHSHFDPPPSKPNNKDRLISQFPNTDKPPPGPIIRYKRKFTPLSQPENPCASPKNTKITPIYTPSIPIYTIPHSSPKHSSSHQKKNS